MFKATVCTRYKYKHKKYNLNGDNQNLFLLDLYTAMAEPGRPSVRPVPIEDWSW